MKYEEQIKSPKWQKRRLEILQLDDFTCQVCGCKDKTLHVHHLHYEKGKKIWEYPDSSLITLCEDCHQYEHDDKGKGSISLVIEKLEKKGITHWEICMYLANLVKSLEETEYVIKFQNRDLKANTWLERLALRRIETKKSHE